MLYILFKKEIKKEKIGLGKKKEDKRLKKQTNF